MIITDWCRKTLSHPPNRKRINVLFYDLKWCIMKRLFQIFYYTGTTLLCNHQPASSWLQMPWHHFTIYNLGTIRNNHADCTAFMVSYELYHYHYIVHLELHYCHLTNYVRGGSGNHQPITFFVICGFVFSQKLCSCKYESCHLLFETLLWLVSFWRSELRSWRTANYPH